MVRIRLSRGGSKKRPFFHVVATNSRSSRDGKYIERLGFYNPIATDDEEDIKIDLERINYWESAGAQLSDKVRYLLKLLELSREERSKQKNEKINKKKAIRQEGKAEEAKAEEPEAETEAKPEAAEEAKAEEPEAETEAEPEAAEEAKAEEPDKDKNDNT